MSDNVSFDSTIGVDADPGGSTYRSSSSISIQTVSKKYGSFTALDSVSLDIAAGEFVTLLGPSGSGKTTLLNIIAGFIRLDSGRVFFGNRDVSKLPPHRRDLGMVFQNYALFPHMSVARNVEFPLRARSFNAAERAERVQLALTSVRLKGLGDRRIDELSGGQRQRVALARAVVFDPKIILMDEPLSALDKQLREDMQIELRQLHEKLGSTTVYVTHDQREALTLSDRIAVMKDGRLVQVGTPHELYEQPNSKFVAEFIGETSLLPVVRSGDNEVSMKGTVLRTTGLVPGFGSLLLVARAEKLRIVEGQAPASNCFRATVERTVYQGDSVLVVARIDGEPGNILIRCSVRQGEAVNIPSSGHSIQVFLDPKDTVIVSTE
jgi:putative spermidine/putrescine transport system ATP-binding protein